MGGSLTQIKSSLTIMKSFLSTLTILSSALVYSPIALSEDVYDLQDFVVSGVSLGDDAKQVISGLTNFYSVSIEDLDITTEYEGTAIKYIRFIAEGSEIFAYLKPKSDSENSSSADNAQVLAFLSETYDQPIENYEKYVSELTKQYGAPSKTLKLPNRSVYGWCEKINSDGFFCDTTYPMYSVSRNNFELGIK